jgi:hypothetical protein
MTMLTWITMNATESGDKEIVGNGHHGQQKTNPFAVLWTDDDHYEDADDGNGEENTEGRKAIKDYMHSGVTRTKTRFRDVEAMDHTIEDATIGNVPEFV